MTASFALLRARLTELLPHSPALARQLAGIDIAIDRAGDEPQVCGFGSLGLGGKRRNEQHQLFHKTLIRLIRS